MSNDKTIDMRCHLTQELGELSPDQKEAITEILTVFMAEIRGLLHEATAELDEVYPDRKQPCGSCAFNPLTDTWDGFLPTAYNVARAIIQDHPFVCHANQPKWRKRRLDVTLLEPCEGFVSINAFCLPEAKNFAEVAMRKIQAIAGLPSLAQA